jgi:hypothetical protein
MIENRIMAAATSKFQQHAEQNHAAGHAEHPEIKQAGMMVRPDQGGRFEVIAGGMVATTPRPVADENASHMRE